MLDLVLDMGLPGVDLERGLWLGVWKFYLTGCILFSVE